MQYEMHIAHMSYSLNSLKGGCIGDYIGTTIGVIKGDTRSLDNGTYLDPFHTIPLGGLVGLLSGVLGLGQELQSAGLGQYYIAILDLP